MLRYLFVGSFLGLIFISSIPAQEEQRGIRWLGSKREGIDLYTITLWIQRETGKKFLWDEGQLNLKAKKIIFITDKDIPRAEDKFAIYQSILEVSGFGLIRVGEGDRQIYKIVSATMGVLGGRSKLHTGPTDVIIQDGRNLQDRFITRLFSLTYVSAREVHSALQNISTPGAITPIEAANMIIASDYDYNIEKYAKIIQTLDVKKPDIEMKVIQLRNALAVDVEQMLNTLAATLVTRQPLPGMPPGRQEQIKIVADRRTNSVIILAEPQRMPQIVELVEKLDMETALATTGVYIHHLKHTNAKDIVNTLKATFGDTLKPVGPPQPGQPTQPVPPGAPSPIAVPPIIVADQPSNSIIIVTDMNTYRNIAKLIQRLDQRKPQVLIKAAIVELRGADKLDIGMELATVDKPGKHPRGFGITSFQLSTFEDIDGDKIPDRVPIETPGVTLGIFKKKIGNIMALFKALKGKTEVNIISEPEAITNDNTTAVLEVTERIPYIQQVVHLGVITPTVQYADAVTKIYVTPHISETQYLRLDTVIRIQRFGVQETTELPPPSTSKELTTNVTIPNASTIVIGGLSTDEGRKSVQGIPFVSDIPIIGNLFKRKTVDEDKTRLYIFITPYILYDERFGDIREMTRERKHAAERIRKKPLDLPIEPPKKPGFRSTYRLELPEKSPPRK